MTILSIRSILTLTYQAIKKNSSCLVYATTSYKIIPTSTETCGTIPMTRPTPLKFQMQGGIKQLRLERDNLNKGWMIWLNANGDFTLGTFIRLLDCGKVERVTWLADGSESIFEMDGM